MPLKLNVGLSKKIGLPGYGSLGASVNLELELDSSAIGDPDRLRQQVRHLFGQAKLSIEEELHGQQTTPHGENGHSREPHRNGIDDGSSRPTTERANGRNGHSQGPSSNGRAATNSQARAIRAIAGRQGLDLRQLLGSRFRLQRPEDLSLTDASALIDELKTQNPADGGSR